MPNNRMVYDTRRMLAYYRLSPDGRMVWGGEGTFSGAGSSTSGRGARPDGNVFGQRSQY